MSRERTKIRKAEEAVGLEELTLGTVPEPHPARDFAFAVSTRRSYVARIAAVLRRDGSARFERAELDLAAVSAAAAAAGAAALAIATDAPLFGARIQDLHDATDGTSVPRLRLDYVVDVRQARTARMAGADAILVSAGMLEGPHLQRLVEESRGLGLAVVVESRDERDLDRALRIPYAIHGLGDLTGETGEWAPERVALLSTLLPQGAVAIALSGVRGLADLDGLQGHVDAALVGAPWLRELDPVAAAADWFNE